MGRINILRKIKFRSRFLPHYLFLLVVTYLEHVLYIQVIHTCPLDLNEFGDFWICAHFLAQSLLPFPDFFCFVSTNRTFHKVRTGVKNLCLRDSSCAYTAIILQLQHFGALPTKATGFISGGDSISGSRRI